MLRDPVRLSHCHFVRQEYIKTTKHICFLLNMIYVLLNMIQHSILHDD